jgi:hypothetical protein
LLLLQSLHRPYKQGQYLVAKMTLKIFATRH